MVIWAKQKLTTSTSQWRTGTIKRRSNIIKWGMRTIDMPRKRTLGIQHHLQRFFALRSFFLLVDWLRRCVRVVHSIAFCFTKRKHNQSDESSLKILSDVNNAHIRKFVWSWHSPAHKWYTSKCVRLIYGLGGCCLHARIAYFQSLTFANPTKFQAINKSLAIATKRNPLTFRPKMNGALLRLKVRRLENNISRHDAELT